jgi:hypothetical protein
VASSFVLAAGASRWERVADMPTARSSAEAVLLADGSVAVVGGSYCLPRVAGMHVRQEDIIASV